MREFLRDTVKLMELRAENAGLELTWEVAPDVPERVFADAVRFRQIILNLIGNSIKFTEQGEIVVGVKLVRQGADDAELQISVRDTGIGIAPDRIKTIFEAFQQADTSTTRIFGGTGLGLAISSRLVDLMGGRIWVESEVSHGSTFYFTCLFELQGESVDDFSGSTTSKSEPGSFEAVGPKNILLAEDGLANQKLALAMLEKWNHRVTLATNGREAVDAWSECKFDLILMDLQMPLMDGLAATREIRRRERETGQHIPIIAMTAHAMPGDRDKCLQAGMDGYLSKPVRKDTLHAALSAIAGKQNPVIVEASVTSAARSNALIDWAAAMEVVSGDEAVLKSIAAIAIDELDCLTHLLSAQIADLNLPDSRKTAHTLLGTLRVFQNEKASKFLEQLQAPETQAAKMVSTWEQLEPMLKRILVEITHYHDGGDSPQNSP